MSALLLIGFAIGTAYARTSVGGYAKRTATRIGPKKCPPKKKCSDDNRPKTIPSYARLK